MIYKVYYDLKTLKKDIPKLKDAVIIAPKELEKYISRMRTYDYKDFKYMLEKQNIKITFVEGRKENNEKLR